MSNLAFVSIISGFYCSVFLMSWSLQMRRTSQKRLWVSVLGVVTIALVVFGIEVPGSEDVGSQIREHGRVIMILAALTASAGFLLGTVMRANIKKLEKSMPRRVGGLTLIDPD